MRLPRTFPLQRPLTILADIRDQPRSDFRIGRYPMGLSVGTQIFSIELPYYRLHRVGIFPVEPLQYPQALPHAGSKTIPVRPYQRRIPNGHLPHRIEEKIEVHGITESRFIRAACGQESNETSFILRRISQLVTHLVTGGIR